MKPFNLLIKTGLFIGLIFTAICLHAEALNGFDISSSSIPSDEIFQGGPPRDGIPAIDHPYFVKASKATFMKESDRVLGMVFNQQEKAYPIKVLNWHEIVNDHFNGHAVVISFCPLCGTGMAFDAEMGRHTLSFGVSGLLYQSDILLYDRQTNSLWSQVLSKSINGPMEGRKLTQLAISHTTWKDWKKRHPKTQVMSLETGYARDYSRSPYLGYESSNRLYFQVNHKAPASYHPKEQILGIEVNGQFKAYPFKELSMKGEAKFEDNFAGQHLIIHWNSLARSAYITDKKNNEQVTTRAFWFAWYTFHPETSIFRNK